MSGVYDRFDGTDAANFQPWLTGVRARVEVAGVRDEVKVAHLLRCISGAALQQFIVSMPNPTWIGSVSYLIDGYSDPFAANKMISRFHLRDQAEHETATEYAAALQALCPFSCSHQMYDGQMIARMKHGLRDPQDVKMAIEACYGGKSVNSLIADLRMRAEMTSEKSRGDPSRMAGFESVK